MANGEHVKILQQGIDAWNEWRKKHPEVRPELCNIDASNINLSNIDLINADLVDANLSNAILRGAILKGAILKGANLSRADLRTASFRSADLSNANLSNTDLTSANLVSANLKGARLSDANLSRANLVSANLTRTYLNYAFLISTRLSRANFADALVEWTTFGNVDLREVNGLENIRHNGPSIIGMDTLMRSEGDIPVPFLKGAGISDTLIEYARSLVGRAIEYYTCFMSYSSQDHVFAERLYIDLQAKGVRCWFAPHDMKTGDIIRDRIDQSIRLYDKLLLVLSQHSVQSKWVRFEVEAALDKECEGKPPVLFPVRLDDAVLNSSTSWAAHIQRSRHITDFSQWKQHDDYQRALTRLLRHLQPDTTVSFSPQSASQSEKLKDYY
ncbi:toll/interleukin-1 receptor domain-containing protein [Reticulibacter mediterranei]|uniref:toll/interleukin-1 receptor domain-containing protein n=1 Tax=Reticulibacter mediterranei TaxID=2778369 RepID=UPI001C68B15C|nr:toll/interleukin-1 receptor domain-containing protein [Reticulibacter mediterranei]